MFASGRPLFFAPSMTRRPLVKLRRVLVVAADARDDEEAGVLRRRAAGEQAARSRATRRRTRLRHASAPHAAIAPLRAHERDEQQEDDRHVPQIALFDDRDAAAAVADRFGQRRGVGRREEAAAGVFRNALEQRRAHGGVEVFGVAGRRTQVHGVGAERRRALGRRRFSPRRGPARRARSCPCTHRLSSTVHSSGTSSVLPDGDVTCAVTRPSLTAVYVWSSDLRRQLERLARLDAIDRRGHLDLAGDAVHEPAHETAPERRVRRVLDGHFRVHLPHPRILNRERERFAAAVAAGRRERLDPGVCCSIAVRSTVAPGFTCWIELTELTSGMSSHFASDAFSFSASWTTG